MHKFIDVVNSIVENGPLDKRKEVARHTADLMLLIGEIVTDIAIHNRTMSREEFMAKYLSTTVEQYQHYLK